MRLTREEDVLGAIKVVYREIFGKDVLPTEETLSRIMKKFEERFPDGVLNTGNSSQMLALREIVQEVNN